jgi:hypothetical protein
VTSEIVRGEVRSLVPPVDRMSSGGGKEARSRVELDPGPRNHGAGNRKPKTWPAECGEAGEAREVGEYRRYIIRARRRACC